MASATTEIGDGAESAPAPAPAPLKPSLPWKTRLAISLISSLSDTARRPDGTINRRLLNFLDIKAPPSPSEPIRSIISSDVVVDPTLSRKLWFRVYTPVDAPTAANLPVIIFFHGGGFSFLSAATKSYDIVCRRFARTTPAIVISVEYRLTPEHRFPSQYDDGFDVLKFLDDQFQSSSSSSSTSKLPANADLSKCFLAGDSAGANVAHHVAVRACRFADQFRTLKVIGLVSIQPFFGGQERTESEIRLVKSVFVSVARTDWHWKVFLPEGCDRDHYAVNVSGPNAEDIRSLENFPETMVVVGGYDPLQDWQRRYYEWLKRSEKEASLIEYPTMIHAFYVFPELPESSLFFSHVKEFVARRLAKV